jgi:hypothetical protein
MVGEPGAEPEITYLYCRIICFFPKGAQLPPLSIWIIDLPSIDLVGRGAELSGTFSSPIP